MIREADGRLYVSGPVTLKNAIALLEAGGQYLGRSQTVIDFSEVSEIDSASVSLMLEWSRQARVKGGEVRFANLGEAVKSLTNLYGVEDLILLDAE
ncbi:MAG: STAS domain-containing protein [Betaproteobacteria bacterium]|nr:MAG: STAS domain-containing protein [Betaproteobacteria bacterium]